MTCLTSLFGSTKCEYIICVRSTSVSSFILLISFIMFKTILHILWADCSFEFVMIVSTDVLHLFVSFCPFLPVCSHLCVWLSVPTCVEPWSLTTVEWCFTWRPSRGSVRHHSRHRLRGHNAACECSPEVALKIQFLRLVHSFCDHSEWVQFRWHCHVSQDVLNSEPFVDLWAWSEFHENKRREREVSALHTTPLKNMK